MLHRSIAGVIRLAQQCEKAFSDGILYPRELVEWPSHLRRGLTISWPRVLVARPSHFCPGVIILQHYGAPMVKNVISVSSLLVVQHVPCWIASSIPECWSRDAWLPLRVCSRNAFVRSFVVLRAGVLHRPLAGVPRLALRESIVGWHALSSRAKTQKKTILESWSCGHHTCVED